MNTRICSPVLETDEIKYSVQPGTGFLDDGYYRVTRQVHPAIDLNAVTGGDTDYGNRVRACADGVVVAAGNYSSWGGIVLIHHPQLGVWTQYAHLINITVRAGQTIGMGTPIGQIGKGERNQFLAHLHFEVRRSDLPAQFWPSARFPEKVSAERYIREHYLDPEDWLEQHHALRTLKQVETVLNPVVTAQPAPVPPPEAIPTTAPLPFIRLVNRAGEQVETPYTEATYHGVRFKRVAGGIELYPPEAK